MNAHFFISYMYTRIILYISLIKNDNSGRLPKVQIIKGSLSQKRIQKFILMKF